MSGLEFVSLDGLVDEPAPIPEDVVVDPTRAARRALVEILWRLAEDAGRLRRAGAPAHLVDRIGAGVEDALGIAAPTAAELVEAGVEVDVALEVARDRGERIRRLLGLEDDS